jgi:hypothetical protein
VTDPAPPAGLDALSAEHWDDRRCANAECRRPLNGSPEFVLQVTTKHVRWFCKDYCLIEGRQRHHDAIAAR